MLLLVAALEAEFQPFLRRREFRPLKAGPGPRCYTGSYAGQELLLLVTGVGPARAATAAEGLLAQRPHAIIAVGGGGACRRDLEPGMLVLCRESASPQGPPLEASERLLAAAQAAAREAGLSYLLGRAWTSPRLASVGEKTHLFQRHGADVVEMEGYPLALAARRHRALFLSTRVLLDTAREQLPAYLERLVTPEGRPRWTGFLWEAVLRPWRWAALYQWKRRSDLVGQVLDRFLSSLVPLLAGREVTAAL